MKYLLLTYMLLLVAQLVRADDMVRTDSIISACELDGVEVTGNARGSDVRSISPQFTISSEDFLRLNITDIGGALRRLPGVTMKDYGGAGGMKTVSVRGLGTHHTALSLDGLVVSDMQSGQVDFQQYALSEITMLRLSIAGTDDMFVPARNLASASTIAIETMTRDWTPVNRLEARAEAGSWGRAGASASVLRRNHWVGLSLNGGYLRATNDYPFIVHNGVATHQERRTNSNLQQGYVGASLDWRLSERATMRSMVRLSDNDRLLPGIVRLYTNENDESLRDRSALAQSVLTIALTERLRLRSALRWQWAKQAYHNGIPSGGIRSERYAQREYYATASLLYSPWRSVEVDYSADWFLNDMTTTLVGNRHPQRRNLLQAVSAKWQRHRWRLVGNVLNSNISGEHHLSPTLEAAYSLTLPREMGECLLRGTMKESFRMPTMTEMYYYHLGHQNLKPEVARQLNLGMTLQNDAARVLSYALSADIYINKVEDKIVCIPFNMFVSRYINISQVLGRGADIAATLSLRCGDKHSLTASGNYSYQRIGMREVVERFRDYQIAYTPCHSGSASVAWLNPWANLSVSVVGASQQWTNNEHNGTPMPGYHEWGVSLYRSFPLRRGAVEVRCTVQNVFDADYCIVANYPMPGRSGVVNVRFCM